MKDKYSWALSKLLEESSDRLLNPIVSKPTDKSPNSKSKISEVSPTPDGVSASTHMFLNDDEGEPRIRKYTKERADGSIMTRWEVLDYRGHRASGQGSEGFDSPRNAREFLESNRKKLSAPPDSIKEEINMELIDEDLRKWFKEKWVRFNPQGKIMGPCARGDDSEGKPKCLPQSKAHSLGKKGRASAAAKKRREDPNPERSGKAINVATKTRKKSNEGMEEQLDELKCWPGYTRVKGVPAGAPGSCKKKGKKTTKEDISRRGFLRGIGAAALGGAAGGALSQPTQPTKPTDTTAALQGLRRDDPRVQHNQDVEELAKAIYDRMVAERGRPMDSTQQRKWMTIARTEAEKRLGQISQQAGTSKPQTSGVQRQPSEVRRSSNINNFESTQHQTCPECGGPAYEDEMLAEKKDACYHKVKSRYRVWPSAYGSAALSKCRKVGAKNWGNKGKK